MGLPGEVDEDLGSLVELMRKMKARLGRTAIPGHHPGRIALSVNPFIPKPLTPFQWERMAPARILSSRLAFLEKELGKLGGIDFLSGSVKWACCQGILARGDRRLGKILLSAFELEGDWRQAFRRQGMDPLFYLERERAEAEIFPWDHLGGPLARTHLWGEYRRAKEGR